LYYINVKKLSGILRFTCDIRGQRSVVETNNEKSSIPIAESDSAFYDLFNADVLSWINPAL
jgi:hypothetical protein